MLNRLSATWIGDFFNDVEDYIGYLPAVVIGIGGGLICGILSIAFYTWMPVLFLLAVVLAYVGFGLSLTFSKYSRSNSSTRSALKDYWKLTKSERKMLPKDTQRNIFKYQDATANQAVRKTVAQIIETREMALLPGRQNFIDNVTATRQAIEETNKTYRELL